MYRAPALLPLRRAALAAAGRASPAAAGLGAGGGAPRALSSLLQQQQQQQHRRRGGLLGPSPSCGRRAQSSAASSVAEPLPASTSSSSSSSAVEEQEEGPHHHHHHKPNGHHHHPAAAAAAAAAADSSSSPSSPGGADAAVEAAAATTTAAAAAEVLPVGAESLEAVAVPAVEQQQQQEQPAVKEATHGVYPGENVLPFTSELRVLRPDGYPKHPVYRVLEPDGSVRDGALEPQIAPEVAVRMYGTMARLQAMDQIFYNAQRQGRVSFYMTSTGEEATHIGSAAALQPTDLVLAQYREAGVLMWRGFSLRQFADQCFSNSGDLGKGRQMPVHYGTAALHFQTISSPLATQIPQAVGAAYGFKLEDKAEARPPEARRCAVCYFGEGAASEGDFHAALNFSATLEAPVLFFCRNNGFAISTPVKDQFRGDGILSRAQGYGLHAIRVDGNDLLAVYNATQAAREVCTAEGKPVLVEAMTYRVGHHSTSDDSTRYRNLAEIKHWQEAANDPLARFRRYLERKGWWTPEQETQLRDAERLAVLRALEAAEGKPKPPLSELFTDVYAEKPQHLKEQEAALAEHIAKYPEHYDGGGH